MTDATGIRGCLLGGAVGDALGLPAEGLSRRRLAARWRGKWDHRFFAGRGWCSDDTEHSLMVAAALVRHRTDAAAFQRSLARSFRWWLAALPAGVGLGTARAVLKLWCGWPPARAGVRSAGNGAAMRSAIIGVFFAEDPARRLAFTEASARLTHTDARAIEAAQLVAEAAACACGKTGNAAALQRLQPLVHTPAMAAHWQHLVPSLGGSASVDTFAETIGCQKGVSGFAPHTVAVALYAWLRHRGDFRATLEAVLDCGGDTDSTAAIAGGITGAECPPETMPSPWLQGLADWPRSQSYMEAMATALASGADQPPPLCWPAVPLRNAVFLLVVLGHGLRRAFPPW